MSMIARISVGNNDPVYEREVKNVMEGVRHNTPELFAEMRPRPSDVRRFLRERGLPIPEGKTTADVPLLRLSGPIATASVREFARKLFLALHYKETGRIVPHAGAILWWWWSNLQAVEGKIPQEIPPMMTGYRKLARANRILNDQFAYRHEISVEGDLGMYMARFNNAFFMTGIIMFDEAQITETPEDRENMLKPFSPI